MCNNTVYSVLTRTMWTKITSKSFGSDSNQWPLSTMFRTLRNNAFGHDRWLGSTVQPSHTAVRCCRPPFAKWQSAILHGFLAGCIYGLKDYACLTNLDWKTVTFLWYWLYFYGWFEQCFSRCDWNWFTNEELKTGLALVGRHGQCHCRDACKGGVQPGLMTERLSTTSGFVFEAQTKGKITAALILNSIQGKVSVWRHHFFIRY